MSAIIEVGIGAIFELPETTKNGAKHLNDPMFWVNAKSFKDAEITYRHLLEIGYPLVFHIYAENQQTANAEAIAIKQLLGEQYTKARFEGGVGKQKLPFQSLCCVDDNVSYLYQTNSEMKAIVDRPYNAEINCLEYREVIRQMYRLKEPTQMTQLAMFMRNRKELFI